MDKLRILVIDDEPKNIKFLEASLVPLGYDVLKASSGMQALKMLDVIEPHLIILDINMPEMSGITFFEQISDTKGFPRFPVLVLTARDNVEKLFKSFFVDGFMTKPFEIKHLLVEIGIILSKRIGKKIETSIETDRSKSLLIVENDQFILNRCSMCFIQAGFTVGIARSGSAALQRAFMDQPDLILVDLQLPDMAGDVFITKLKQMPKTMDILLLLYSSLASSFNSSVINQLCKKAGIHEVVVTDDPQTLLNTVRSVLKIDKK